MLHVTCTVSRKRSLRWARDAPSLCLDMTSVCFCCWLCSCCDRAARYTFKAIHAGVWVRGRFVGRKQATDKVLGNHRFVFLHVPTACGNLPPARQLDMVVQASPDRPNTTLPRSTKVLWECRLDMCQLSGLLTSAARCSATVHCHSVHR